METEVHRCWRDETNRGQYCIWRACLRRWRSEFVIIIVHLQGITRITEQWHQLIKRMEPLTKENEKLKAVMNLTEINIQRAHRERDLIESNTRDLEYQKGVLSK